uniref:Uncharacterized protein n=1 Tax=Opuntia streptacantha TaxID=393608 RepID=A0A7C8ZMU4_OPUST
MLDLANPRAMAFTKPKDQRGGMMKNMLINKKKENQFQRPPSYVKLKSKDDDDDESDEWRTPKGHVPVMVGKEEGSSKRFAVPTRFMKDPSIAALLQLSADELGYDHQGIVQIPCHPEYFEAVLGKLSKRR